MTDPRLVTVRRVRGHGEFAPKWNVYIILPPLLSSGNTDAEKEEHQAWADSCEAVFLDRTALLFCGSLPKIKEVSIPCLERTPG